MSGEMLFRDAARKGGQTTLARHGQTHYRRLAARTNGRAGWRAQQTALGPDGRAAMAKNGGDSTLAHHGRDYYARISEASRGPRRRPPAKGMVASTVSGVDTPFLPTDGQQTSPGGGS